MREIILDTETTGLDPASGHRIIEIGAVEVSSRMPTGRTFHAYLNPERDIDAGAVRVHGLTTEKLAGMPTFAEVVDDMLAFFEDLPLVAHNAPFDIGFLNAELGWLERPALTNEVIDTLPMARKKFPGARASLDALCQRFEVDASDRTLHGALLDARLLAEVYVHLTGGLQPTFLGENGATDSNGMATSSADLSTLQGEARPPRHFPIPDAELAAHQAFINAMGNSLWVERGEN